MEVTSSPSSINRYLPSGLSSLSTWPLHDDRHPPTRTISSVPIVPDAHHHAPTNLDALTMALRADQRTSNLYVEVPRCPPARAPHPPVTAPAAFSYPSSMAPPYSPTNVPSYSPVTISSRAVPRSSGHRHSKRLPTSLSSHEDRIIQSVSPIMEGTNRSAAVRSSEPKLPRRCNDPSSAFIKLNSELSSKNNSINSRHNNTSPTNAPEHHINATSHKCLELSEKIISSESGGVVINEEVKGSMPRERQADASGVMLGTDNDDIALGSCRQTIACKRCGGCRCDVCIGGGRTRLQKSARRVIDTLSCLCCVQSVLYHCRGSCAAQEVEYEAGEDPSDRPCSCTGGGFPPGCARGQEGECCRRWACMVVASLTCLPCLLLYWPLTLMLAICGRCYDACTSLTRSPRGCRCRLNLGGTDGYKDGRVTSYKDGRVTSHKDGRVTSHKDGRMTSSSVREYSSEGPASTSFGHELLSELDSIATSQCTIAHKFELV